MKRLLGFFFVIWLCAACAASHHGTLPQAQSHGRHVLAQNSSTQPQALQMFDDTQFGYISSGTASQVCNRYGIIWGAGIGGALYGPANWKACGTLTGWYIPLETDSDQVSYGGYGNTLSWYKANHPDWVLMECSESTNQPVYDSSGNPIPAYIGGQNGKPGPSDIPLDIHNASAIAPFIVNNKAAKAAQAGWNFVAMDEVSYTYAGGDVGDYPCGIFTNWSDHSTFVRRYDWTAPGHDEPGKWTADVIEYVKTIYPLLSNVGMYLIINHSMDYGLSTNEETLMQKYVR